LQEIVRVCYDQLRNAGLDFQALSIQRLVDEKKQVFGNYTILPSGEYQERIEPRPGLYDEWQNRKLVYRRDLSQSQYQQGLPSQYWENTYRRFGIRLRCILNMPHQKGVLTLRSVRPDVFSDSDIIFIQTVAETLSIGIARIEDLEALEIRNSALEESEGKYRTLFETMSQGIVYQNADGAIISANPSAQRILGLTLDQMQGRTSIDSYGSQYAQM